MCQLMLKAWSRPCWAVGSQGREEPFIGPLAAHGSGFRSWEPKPWPRPTALGGWLVGRTTCPCILPIFFLSMPVLTTRSQIQSYYYFPLKVFHTMTLSFRGPDKSFSEPSNTAPQCGNSHCRSTAEGCCPYCSGCTKCSKWSITWDNSSTRDTCTHLSTTSKQPPSLPLRMKKMLIARVQILRGNLNEHMWLVSTYLISLRFFRNIP